MSTLILSLPEPVEGSDGVVIAHSPRVLNILTPPNPLLLEGERLSGDFITYRPVSCYKDGTTIFCRDTARRVPTKTEGQNAVLSLQC
jgi:hypothetical protein